MNALHTARLLGRPCEPGDVPHIADLFGREEIRSWTSPPGLDWTRARFESVTLKLSAHWLAHGWGPRLWFRDRAFVALAGLQFAVIDGRGAVEIAYAVHPTHQRNGYAREILAAILAEAPEIASEIAAAVVQGNAPSLHLLAASGFRPAGTGQEDGRTLEYLTLRTA